MKDTKSVLLLIVSFLLFVVSFTLLWTWGYRVYIKTPSQQTENHVLAPAGASVPGTTRDSLQHMYAAAVSELDSRLDSTFNNADSLHNTLDIKLGEFYRLKHEIAALLKNHDSDAGLSTAREKIGELQQKVNELLNRNRDVETENRKLAAVLAQLTGRAKVPADAANYQRVSFDNSTPAEKNIPAAIFTVSDLHLSAIALDNEKETETNQAERTEKLVGSIVIKNSSVQYTNTDIMVVVMQPDGRVLKNSVWESGVFNTAEGKKIYSYKLRIDNSNGETRRLLFSLNADAYQKGDYTMQVYHNGVLVGRLVKTLS